MSDSQPFWEWESANAPTTDFIDLNHAPSIGGSLAW